VRPAQIAALHPRLSAVLSELATGFYRQARATIIAEQEGLQSALLAARDEAEAALRVREERLRTVLANAPLILFTTDHTGTITLVEGNGLQALDISPNQMIGQSVFDIARRLPRADVRQISEHFHRALAGEAFRVIGTMAGLFFETRYAPLRDEQGDTGGVIGVALDITERRRVEAELTAAQQRLVEYEKPTLTDDELAVLQHVAMGKSYHDIGNELGMSARTVRRHVKAMYKRLGAENRTQLVRRAIQLGLLND
jgi:PAS domain S-box-containing protein